MPRGGYRPGSGRKPGYARPELRLSADPLYGVFHGMIRRCEDQNCDDYPNYGGRGIIVCLEWRHNFPLFRAWALSHNYKSGLTIDRENTNGNYSPDNCRFVSYEINNNNRRNNVKVTAFEETKTLTQWSQDHRCVVGRKSLERRIYRGWAPERALTQEI